jgi:hypothetical protein
MAAIAWPELKPGAGVPLIRADDGLERAERRERHHAAGCVADVELGDVGRRTPRILLGLHGDAEGAAEQIEVVHVK